MAAGNRDSLSQSPPHHSQVSGSRIHFENRASLTVILWQIVLLARAPHPCSPSQVSPVTSLSRNSSLQWRDRSGLYRILFYAFASVRNVKLSKRLHPQYNSLISKCQLSCYNFWLILLSAYNIICKYCLKMTIKKQYNEHTIRSHLSFDKSW